MEAQALCIKKKPPRCTTVFSVIKINKTEITSLLSFSQYMIAPHNCFAVSLSVSGLRDFELARNSES